MYEQELLFGTQLCLKTKFSLTNKQFKEIGFRVMIGQTEQTEITTLYID